ncbi:hypothetical protein [Lysobacter sp. HA18]
MYEHRGRPPLTRAQFLRRIGKHVLVASALLALSLGIGMVGYMAFESLTPTDAFLNASMLLGGMGPVDAPKTQPGKLFAGLYALYAGLVFLVAAGLVVAPMAHRLLHRFHWEADGKSS